MESKKSNSMTSSQNGNGSQKSNSTSMQSSQLMKLFEDGLKDIYWAEKALTKAIPKMAKNATSQKLIEALKSHLAETENQITRVEQVFESIGKKATAKKCEAMEGLLKEAEEIMESCDEGAMRDAGIISAAQKVEHYEIASYGTLCAFAKTLGKSDAAALLQQILDEEKQADVKLSKIAQTINVEAADEDESDADSDTMVATKSKRK
jgi:ferritin-like metal-binding protein YciE